MIPLALLVGVFILSLLAIKLRTSVADWRLAGRIAMCVMLVFTAVSHFIFTDGMEKMIPGFLPFKRELVYLTGIMEILFGVGLLIPAYKTRTGWILILFFLALLPANIHAALENINYQTGAADGHGVEYLWFRVPLQLFFMAWVYFTAIRDRK